MRVLVVGSGGREHALVWKIAQSPRVKAIFAAPGNGGMAKDATLVDIKADDIEGLRAFAIAKKIDFTVIGPEAPLVKGIVDTFEKEGLRVFGPGKEAARLEGSKAFSKEIMEEFGVPTAPFGVFTNKADALAYIEEKGAPCVIKADGLAAGKGVFVCKTKDAAVSAVEEIITKRVFGDAGKKVVIEECLAGEEASIIVVSDGENIAPMASSQDHKRIFDNDEGPNTGGMGAYSPAPIVAGAKFGEVVKTAVEPVIKGLKDKGTPYKGALYAGIMMTDKGPYVLEFNVRFGDPETQAMLPRMKSDIVDIIEASIDGTLDKAKNEWDDRDCVSIVAASKGYPGSYKKGKEIKGIDAAEGLDGVVVFHAGTRKEGGKVLTDGGRVLGITALGNGIDRAAKKAYEAASKISFDGIYYRRDIARRALNRKACSTS
jgi:phosphoribosylamine--glycine ligase